MIHLSSQSIETCLEALFSNLSCPKELIESALYSLLGGGKRLRPRITLAISTLYEVPEEKALVPACVLELIHTYSLIHDDLPCMDNDDMRRGKPSLHKKYSEWQALLTGDFLLTYAFEVLASLPDISSQQKIDLIKTLSLRAGAEGMIGGQQLDLSIKDSSISWESLKNLHLKKTGALIQAAFEFGGILGNNSELDLLKTIGQEYGLLFQLKDDLNDQDDLEENRPSSIRTLGIKKTQQMIEDLTHSILNKISSLKDSNDVLKKVLFH